MRATLDETGAASSANPSARDGFNIFSICTRARYPRRLWRPSAARRRPGAVLAKFPQKRVAAAQLDPTDSRAAAAPRRSGAVAGSGGVFCSSAGPLGNNADGGRRVGPRIGARRRREQRVRHLCRHLSLAADSGV